MTSTKMQVVFAMFIGGVFAASTPANANPFTGPVSKYYLDSYNLHKIEVVQGTSVIYSFNYAYSNGSGPYQEGMLAVTDTVRTNAFTGDNGPGGISGQYTLAGVATGVQYNEAAHATSPDFAYDGTSDGSYNYYVQYNGGGTVNMIRTGLDWQSEAILFTLSGVSSGQYLGTTYDATNNSIWVSGYGANSIRDYSMTGTLLSSFVTPNNALAALAMDPSDHTLWVSISGGTTLQQYSTSGVLLQQGTPTGLDSCCFLSGEFSESGGSVDVPEPSSLLLAGSGLVALTRKLRRK